MNNLWLLTEERPKPSVIEQIVNAYCIGFDDVMNKQAEVRVKPVIENGIFKFLYEVEGISTLQTNKIYIKTVSGNSSFLDFLLFRQSGEPIEQNDNNNLIMAVEETKTSDEESRNTGVYQRGSKFVYINAYYKNIKLYMLYNEELGGRKDKRPSDTSIFGTNILLTLGVNIIGKNTSRWFYRFNDLDELINFKNKMRQPPANNVPIIITQYGDRIEISGRLAKPANAGNIAHDPNIGALSMISACIRKLGWNKDIVITKHGVAKEYITHNHTSNKFLRICNILGIKLAGIDMPSDINVPTSYWHYERRSEKMADILLHIQAEYCGMYCVYENHAGCERGYFRTKDKRLIALPKKDRNGNNLYLPDVVLYDARTNFILLVESKMMSTLRLGLRELANYDSIEREYIRPEYKDATILRCLSIFGGDATSIPHEKVIFYLSNDGRIIINPKAPKCVKRCFEETGVNI